MVDSETSSVFSTLALGVVVCAVILVVFELARKKYVDVYIPNVRRSLHKSNQRIKPPSKKLGGWLRKIWSIEDEEMYQVAGMDAYVYLRFLKMCCKITSLCAVLSIILIALYGTSSTRDDVNGINYYSLANVPSRNYRLWPPLILTYLFTFIFLYFFYREYENFALKRTEYLKNGDSFIPKQTSYSVLVENIPSNLVTSERLYQFFHSLFPHQIVHATVATEITLLDQLVYYRTQLLSNLEKYIAIYEASERKERPTIDFRSCTQRTFESCCCRCCYGSSTPPQEPVQIEKNDSSSVDAIEYLQDQLKIINEEIDVLQLEAIKAEADMNYFLFQCNTKRVTVGRAMLMPEDTSSQRISELAEEVKAVVVERKVSAQIVHIDIGENINGENSSRLAKSIDESVAKLKNIMVESKNVDKYLWTTIMDDKEDVLTERITMKNMSATGFVTFKSRRTQLIATRLTVFSEESPLLTVTPAPPPSDIIWENIGANALRSARIMFIVSVGYCFGLIFWGILLSFVAGLSNLSDLQRAFPFLGHLDQASLSVIQGLVPVIVLLILNLLLPLLMWAIGVYVEHKKTHSEVQYKVFQWFYFYQLANVYIILIAGSFTNSATDFYHNPSGALGLIAAALPTTSTLFINYCITTLLISTPFQLLQLLPFIYYVVVRRFSKKEHYTRRMIVQDILYPVQMDYGSYLPSSLYILTIALLYWVIAPILLIVVAMVFAASYLVLKYQFLYIFVRKYESGGIYWYGLFKYSMISLLFSTFTMIAYLSIKKGIFQAPLLVPLLFIIYLFWKHTESRFHRLSENIPYCAAMNIDLSEDAKTHKEWESFRNDHYKQPSLLAKEKLQPYPYRLNGQPLIRHGRVNPIYYDDYDPTVEDIEDDEQSNLESNIKSESSPDESPVTPAPPVPAMTMLL
jgi:hypothetical protein